MLDLKDFSIFENQVSFDFKGFLIKSGVIGSGFISLLILLPLRIKCRKEKIYGMDTLISVKESNPLFTSNTSLVFNGVGLQIKFRPLPLLCSPDLIMNWWSINCNSTLIIWYKENTI
jgi:hypothetical protein